MNFILSILGGMVLLVAIPYAILWLVLFLKRDE